MSDHEADKFRRNNIEQTHNHREIAKEDRSDQGDEGRRDASETLPDRGEHDTGNTEPCGPHCGPTARDGEQASDYKIGRGKPPKEHRFHKGRSGNPKGRPKSKLPQLENKHELLAALLAEKISVQENGKPCKITRQEFLYRSVFNQGAKGSLAAVLYLLKEGDALPHHHKNGHFYVRIAERDLDIAEKGFTEMAKRYKIDTDG